MRWRASARRSVARAADAATRQGNDDELAAEAAAAADQEHAGRAQEAPVPEGLWIKCPACEAVLYRTDLENNLYVCPKCSHHTRVAGARAHRAAARSGGPLRDRLRGRAGRQPQVQGPEEVPGAARRGARGDRRDRRAGRDAGQRQERAAGARRVRVRVHGRLDGLGGRRALRARRARRLREPHAVRLHLGLGRRAHAGGRQLAVPDGEDDRGAAGARPRRGCRSSRSSPIRRWAASRRPSRSSADVVHRRARRADRLRRARA